MTGSVFDSIYQGRSTVVTGHTGFKGSWLRLWLERLGAKVSGYALDPSTNPNHFNLLKLQSPSTIGDIRDLDGLLAHFKRHEPEVVFHLAAQASVLYSYEHAIETFGTNVLGTANVLEACRRTPQVRAVVIVTTDKCYENKEWVWGYRETDRLGGRDPYSASKACAEIVAASYAHSFANVTAGRDKPLLVATARGGNVVGGGDWTADRIIPDAMRAAAAGEKVRVRNPDSSRPWQHVLELLSGYLLLGQGLLEGKAAWAEPWNFGPNPESNVSVGTLVNRLKEIWSAVVPEIAPRKGDPHEARLLMLDSSKARQLLRWQPVWGIADTLTRTAEWYRAYYQTGQVLSANQIDAYVAQAAQQSAVWAK
ncbi:MAG: rfbG [Acidobacteria bacterium]|nr:rfbG [Acidobacteriota bacterium]